ncbi:MAG: heme ABC exporter ATP-binding protein CcmA [Acidimicrobiia bacterium]|nr:MAG: heme ABC exporter ATP-binding protein CcmA [Acidimicrobiia bacterium]
MTGSLISLEGVALRRTTTLILRAVDLEVAPGEAVGLFGANGSGKTTLLRLIATLARPSAGSGRILGAPLGTGAVEAVRPRIALIGHEPALAPSLTLAENLRLFARLSGAEPEAAARALDEVGLAGAAGRRADQCSNGMRRRAEFARVALTEPEVLLLDEAHVGLDPAAATLVERTVAATLERGGCAIVVSHERERVAPLISRSVLLVDGRLEAA